MPNCGILMANEEQSGDLKKLGPSFGSSPLMREIAIRSGFSLASMLGLYRRRAGSYGGAHHRAPETLQLVL
jgi:hypothetical protein